MRPGTPISWLFKKSGAVEQDEYDIVRQTLKKFLDDHNDDDDIEIDYKDGSAALRVYGSREDLQTLQNLLRVLGGLREQDPFQRLEINEKDSKIGLLIRIKDSLEGIIDHDYADRLAKRFIGDKRLI